MEIGSEFWIGNLSQTESTKEIPPWITQFGNIIMTASGRGAISLVLDDVDAKVKAKTALLPAYICESVILPFVAKGYKCYFYGTNSKLMPIIKDIEFNNDLGIFLHMGYYGFPTNNNLANVVKLIKNNSTIIIEDITHTLFSDYQRFEENDYYVASVRKWFGLPSGGFVASKRLINCRLECNEIFSDVRERALRQKACYMNNTDERVKRQYLDLFIEGENFLDNDLTPYDIDNLSINLINGLDKKKIIEKRQSNFNILSEGITGLEYIKPVFDDLSERVCPLFYPVYIRGKRSVIRQKLIEHKIYCPIHWTKPRQVNDLKNTEKIYETVLSLPCDQRYDTSDMERVIEIIRGLKVFII